MENISVVNRDGNIPAVNAACESTSYVSGMDEEIKIGPADFLIGKWLIVPVALALVAAVVWGPDWDGARAYQAEVAARNKAFRADPTLPPAVLSPDRAQDDLVRVGDGLACYPLHGIVDERMCAMAKARDALRLQRDYPLAPYVAPPSPLQAEAEAQLKADQVAAEQDRRIREDARQGTQDALDQDRAQHGY
ncbi:MAG TPA: hypothetical protein VMU59_06685 [Caulobacteraceae bacterium]|nr:hypothetical protein [Caulobacteraceae bacterium]